MQGISPTIQRLFRGIVVGRQSFRERANLIWFIERIKLFRFKSANSSPRKAKRQSASRPRSPAFFFIVHESSVIHKETTTVVCDSAFHVAPRRCDNAKDCRTTTNKEMVALLINELPRSTRSIHKVPKGRRRPTNPRSRHLQQHRSRRNCQSIHQRQRQPRRPHTQ